LKTKVLHQDKIQDVDEDANDENEKDPKTIKSIEKLRIILHTKKIREKGLGYLINVLFSMYRSVKNIYEKIKIKIKIKNKKD
jgi:hypothetical protein